tara:strand:- start:34 stop:300 length:267 start_codon:yes stop_codon:yes gene_type:complete
MADTIDTLTFGNTTITLDDPVNKPTHYNHAGIECIDAIRAALTPEEYKGYIKGNNIKYIWREGYKNGEQDLRKANWYMNHYLDKLDDS